MRGYCVTATSGDGQTYLVDTCAAVALLVEDHEHHDMAFEALTDRRLGLAGHAAFETYSVLTRLPPPNRRTAAAVARLLEVNFPDSRFLSSKEAEALLASVADHAIAGGSVYDALAGATAVEQGLPLVSRDRRALPTYRELGADVEVLP